MSTIQADPNPIVVDNTISPPAERTRIWVHSWAREDDGAFGDDTAGSAIDKGKRIAPPDGPAEKVSNGNFKMNIPATSGDLHYAGDVNFAVDYLP